MAFLPLCKADMEARGWDAVDFVYISGDAYVDHPSFGTAIITRMLEAHGYRVGLICQPDWRDPQSIAEYGEPKLAFLVSSGNIDSMVNHYTVAKRKRSFDNYTPGGEMGARPDRACIVYGNLIRQTFKHTPILLGGIEASLRRLAHYDYWSDSIKRSVLMDSGADMLMYGMGEHSMIEIADALASGLAVQDITWIAGTAYRTRSIEHVSNPIMLPSWDELQTNRLTYAKSFAQQLEQLNPYTARPLVEEYPHNVYIVQTPPSTPLTTEEFDAVYALPYERTYHPSYEAVGGVPAIKEVKFSITHNRGCLGECSFCALNFHQGRIIQARSHESILEEARQMVNDPDFKGYIHDVGGPTANFREPSCKRQAAGKGACTNKRCLSPQPCSELRASHKDYIALLRKLRALPGVKKVFVRSGIRFDYALLDPDHTIITELAQHHTSGQLRLAPEHVSDNVLSVMGKPPRKLYDEFVQEFNKASKKAGKEQYVLPYLMSSHPGSTMEEAVKLAEFCRDLGYNPEQVSDFYPTPSTVSTCIFATGIDPRTMKEVYCPRSPHEKAMQRALIQYRNPKNHNLVREALRKAGREDLIGYTKNCLVRPEKSGRNHSPQDAGKTKSTNAAKQKSKNATTRNSRNVATRNSKNATTRNSKSASAKMKAQPR